jgi:hypothetical protein
MRGCITIGSLAVFTPGTIHSEGVSVTELLIQRWSNFPDPGGFLTVHRFPDSVSAYVTFEYLYLTSRCPLIISYTRYVSVKTLLCLVNGFCVSKRATCFDLCVHASINDGDTF